MGKTFYPEIDILKSSAALVVILIHVMANYKGVSDTHFLFWDLIHFSVGIFVFASGFLQGNATREVKDVKDVLSELYIRFKRIALPYYQYVIICAVILGSLTSFNEVFKRFTLNFTWDTLTLAGGFGNNWIPRLFMMLSIAYVLLALIKKRWRSVLPYAYTACFLITIYLLVISGVSGKGWWMLPGWLVLYLSGFYTVKNYIKDNLVRLALFSGILTVVSYIGVLQLGDSTSLFGHKYPPDIFFVTYNLFLTVLFLLLSRWLFGVFKRKKRIMQSFNFLSRTTYEIFFYHLIVMKVYSHFSLKFGIIIDYLLVASSTILLVWVLDKAKGYIGSKFSKT